MGPNRSVFSTMWRNFLLIMFPIFSIHTGTSLLSAGGNIPIFPYFFVYTLYISFHAIFWHALSVSNIISNKATILELRGLISRREIINGYFEIPVLNVKKKLFQGRHL